MQPDHPIAARRSVRRFTNTPVPEYQLTELLSAARLAPSAKNCQPWRFILMRGAYKSRFCDAMEEGLLREQREPFLPHSAFGLPDAKNSLRVMREAPVLLAVLYADGKSPDTPLNVDERFTELCDSLSIGAAVENLLLYAKELGLDTLWIANTCFAYRELTAFLHTPHVLTGVIAIGYGAEHPSSRPRIPLCDLTEYRA